MTVEAVLFDLAGELIDFEPAWEEVSRAFVTEHDVRWQPDSQEQMMGMSTAEWSWYLGHRTVGRRYFSMESMTKLYELTHEKVVQAMLECSQHERGGGRMSLVRVFARCNSGHYFTGHSCPFDGWSSDETRDVARAASRLAERGTRPSFDALVGEGLSAPALARACVAEFPAEAAPEAIEPQTIVVAGRALPLHKAPPSFH